MNGNGTDAIRGDAGRELDARVHEAVFGQPVEWRTARPPHGLLPHPGATEPQFRDAFRWGPVPRYSTEIAAAWAVVERLRETGTVDLFDYRNDPKPGDKRWVCEYEPDDELRVYPGDGPTAPLAICRAALAALEDR